MPDTPRLSRSQRKTAELVAAGGVMTRRQIMFVIAGLMAGMFLSSLNQTVVGTAMRTIADDLNGLALQAWVSTAFLIVATVTTPIYGKLSDLFGRRILFLIAIALFLVGSVLCATADTMYELAIFRGVQGLGGGGLMSLPFAILGDILAPRERAKFQGYFLAVFAVSSMIGPLIGGLFAGTDQVLGVDGWRFVFLINVPTGLVALGLVMAFLHLPRHHHDRVRIDWWGAAAIMLATVPLLLVAEQGREWGWTALPSLLCYALTIVGTAAFIAIERRMGDYALIPLRLFRSNTFAMASLLGALVGFGFFSAMMIVPLYLQLVVGADPTQAGLLTLPMIIANMATSLISGQLIARTGRYRRYPIVGCATMLAGYLFLGLYSGYDQPLMFTMVGIFLVGFGVGNLMQTLTLASQNAVGPRDIGVATSSVSFFRQVGVTLGVAVSFSVLFGRLHDTIAAAFGRSDLVRAALDAALDPAVAGAPQNAAIMDVIYRPILDQVAAYLPAGFDLGNEATRGQVVYQLMQHAGAGELQTGAGGLLDSLNADTSFLNTADAALAAPFLDAFASATASVYWVAAVVMLVALAISLFLKTPPLRERSAMQEALADAAAKRQAAATTAAVPTAGPQRPEPAGTPTRPGVPARG